ncbi:glycosyltransferase [Ornithinimicrobium cryptoxanthini]|uniref:glycosyltransferase n=1 Tax=Ornithinimicrobium cryptoxanthini TaxID=2934161 RepID=UPI00211836E4|nr:glycosyltransferase [Ornithinimicrobium cryptoxanthini]
MSIVTFTSALPHRDIEHAGGKYLSILLETLGAKHGTVVAPPLPNVVRAASLPGHPRQTHITAAVGFFTASVENTLRRLDPGLPSFSVLGALHNDPVARRLVKDATVIDLQWQDSIRLAGAIRRLAPTATIVGTFHDVQSQKYSRLARSAQGRSKIKWTLATRLAQLAERKAMRLLDRVVVFSTKDANLLPPGAPVTVVDPPLAAEKSPSHQPPATPRVVFVALLSRPENREAALWLVQEVWPRVRAQVPTAQLDLVGAGANHELEETIAAFPGVRNTGFVPDLDGVLADATVAAVPVHEGAGVKFKTIEALLAGIPVVTTSIGAEGIDPPSLFWGVADDAATFAEHLVSSLLNGDKAQRRADKAQQQVASRYGPEAFVGKVRAVYGVGPQ